MTKTIKNDYPILTPLWSFKTVLLYWLFFFLIFSLTFNFIGGKEEMLLLPIDFSMLYFYC